jgi:hypothetical protein
MSLATVPGRCLYSPGSNWDLDPLAGLSTCWEMGIFTGLVSVYSMVANADLLVKISTVKQTSYTYLRLGELLLK